MSVSRSVGDLNGVFHQKKNAQGKPNVTKVEPKIIYACNKCSYKSSIKEELRAHKVDKHNIVLPPEIQQTVRKNEPKTNYACTQCSYLSGDKDKLRTHKLAKHGAIPQAARDIKSEPKPSYACTECSFLSADKNELRAHKETKHEKPALVKTEINSITSSRIKEVEAPTHVFACNKCSYKSVQKDELLAHKQVKHQVALPQDAKMKSVSARPLANQKKASGNIWNMNKEDGLVANVFKTFKVDSDANDQIKFSKDTPSASDAAELDNLAAELENSLPPTNKDTNKSTKQEKNSKASNEDFECKICMVTFWYKTQMETHMKDVHGTSETKIETEVYKTPKSESDQNSVSNQLSTSSRNYNHRSTAKSTTDYRRCCQLCNFSADRQEFDMHLKSPQHIQKVENNAKNKNLNQTDQQRRNMSQSGKSETEATVSNDQLNKAAPKRSLPEASSAGPNKSLKLEQSNVQKQNPTNSEIKIIYACNKCSYKSEIKAELRAHKVAQHEAVPLPQKPVIFTPPPLQNQEDDDDEDSVDYSCKIGSCMQSFWYENDLYAHMANVHD